jgi:hypothetical protein
MSKEERARLDALAKSLVSGLAIATTVTYQPATDRLYVDCQSIADPGCGRSAMERGSFTVASEHPNIEQFVRDEIATFLSQSGPWKIRKQAL